MLSLGAVLLMIGASLSMVAAFAHLACILGGAPAYRFMGAGEKMVRAVESGRWRPAIITLGISLFLFVWAFFALSGAGVIPYLPFTKPALVAISAVYLVRAFAFPLLKPVFPENTQVFWLISSATCLVVGLVHAIGLVLQWRII